MTYSKYTLLILTALLILASCGETEIIEIENGYEYFPMEPGRWITYQLDSTFYDNFADTVFTNTYQLREELTDTFYDNEGNLAIGINRFILNETTNAWENDHSWYATKTDVAAERIEENLRFQKMAFPVSVGKQWNGNTHIDTEDPAFANYADWRYEITELDAAKTIGSQSFDKTLTVLQNDYGADNLIQRIYSTETYAKGIGLVYKEFWDLELQTSAPTPLSQINWPDRANRGTIVRLEVIDFGIE